MSSTNPPGTGDTNQMPPTMPTQVHPRVPVPVRHGARTPVRRSRSGARAAAFAVAAVGAVLLWATWWFFIETRNGQLLDSSALNGASYGQGSLWGMAEQVLKVVSITFIVLGLGAAMLIALVRRRWGLVVQVAIFVVGANLSTQLLKHQLIERPDLGVPTRVENSLPSGHTTVAATVSMALVMVVPRRLRPLVAALGAVYTAATGVSTLIGQWHRPSDVIAALLLVLAWTGLVCALTPRSALDRPGKPGRISSTMVATTLGIVAIVAGALAYAILSGEAIPGLTGVMDQSVNYRSYFGMAALVVSTAAATFFGGFLIRQTTARG